MKRWRRWGIAALGVAIAAVVAGLVWSMALPWAANHYGFAMPGRDGLPWRISLYGRDYSSLQVCAGAGWCPEGGAPRCYAQSDLVDIGAWPLNSVGTISTLFGAPRTLLRPVGAVSVAAPIVIADGPGCYVVYALEGGP
jgi:hypothetical protein